MLCDRGCARGTQCCESLGASTLLSGSELRVRITSLARDAGGSEHQGSRKEGNNQTRGLCCLYLGDDISIRAKASEKSDSGPLPIPTLGRVPGPRARSAPANFQEQDARWAPAGDRGEREFLTAVRTLKSSRLMYRNLATFTFPMAAPGEPGSPFHNRGTQSTSVLRRLSCRKAEGRRAHAPLLTSGPCRWIEVASHPHGEVKLLLGLMKHIAWKR